MKAAPGCNRKPGLAGRGTGQPQDPSGQTGGGTGVTAMRGSRAVFCLSGVIAP